MKKILHFLTFCFFLGACYVLRNPDQDDALQPVNAALGDESFKQAYGRLPNADDSEELRKAAPAELSGSVRQNHEHLDYR